MGKRTKPVRKTIRLTDDVGQSVDDVANAPAYLVFGTDTSEERLFHDYQDACDYASNCMEHSGEDSWDVFPLWASDPIVLES